MKPAITPVVEKENDMVLILDTTRPRDFDPREMDRRADLDRRECRRSHAPSALTLQRLGFLTTVTRPAMYAETPTRPSRRSDAVAPEWKPL